ncbi:MAG: ABC-ATPase domain-containing protein, partial [Myxococcota bacterium]
MRDITSLEQTLRRIDGRGYKAYRDIRGGYQLEDAELHVDHVQGDPFAAPSRLRVRIPLARTRLPEDLLMRPVARLALCDLLADRVHKAIGRGGSSRRGSGKSGIVSVDAGGQEVLARSAVVLGGDFVEVRVQAGLPAAGRRVLGREAEALLIDDLPRIAARGLCAEADEHGELRDFVHCVENQEHIRGQLAGMGLLAFVGDGAVLPRETGASDRPLHGEEVVPWESPESLRVEIPLLHPVETAHGSRDTLTGTGLPLGVNLVVGGGYHGKSTLLQALERCVHPHVPGDGREWVVTAHDCVKIRAEDGRRVASVDIAAFIRNLPGGRSTDAFTSDDASGSTSQAANIVEALECGAVGLLLDEDTS